jgi:hypothetical protein
MAKRKRVSAPIKIAAEDIPPSVSSGPVTSAADDTTEKEFWADFLRRVEARQGVELSIETGDPYHTSKGDLVIPIGNPYGKKSAKINSTSEFRSPADWRKLLKKHQRAHSETAWRTFRANFHGEPHPKSRARLIRFPLAELKRAGITVPEVESPQ